MANDGRGARKWAVASVVAAWSLAGALAAHASGGGFLGARTFWPCGLQVCLDGGAGEIVGLIFADDGGWIPVSGSSLAVTLGPSRGFAIRALDQTPAATVSVAAYDFSDGLGCNRGCSLGPIGARGDVDGDGLRECIVPWGHPYLVRALVLDCDLREPLGLKQAITVDDVGYDLAAPFVSFELREETGDGRADLVIRLDGQVSAVLVARPDGTFGRDDVEGDDGGVVAAARLVWSDFRDRLNRGDLAGASALFRTDARVAYELELAAIPDLAAVDDSWTSLVPMSVGPRFAEFSLRQTVDGVTRAFVVSFVKQDDGTWAIGSL